jgi:glycosidase
MQWFSSLPNPGFSAAPAETLYLLEDPDPEGPTVAAQRDDPHSLLRFVEGLIQFRKATPGSLPTGDWIPYFSACGGRSPN